MKVVSRTTVLFVLLSFVMVPLDLFAASANLAEAKKEAEAKGLIFESSHQEIVNKAKKEGKIRVLSSLETNVYPHMISSFKKKYPFLEVAVAETSGTDGAQRFILELKAGRATEFDLIQLSYDFYPEYLPYMKKFDILGMAEHGVIGIPSKMVDPNSRGIVALGTGLFVVAYNKTLISAERVPTSWEDFLKPEFKGRRFFVDIRPFPYAAFASCPQEGLGVDWMVNYAKKIREQEPIWSRGYSRTLTAINAGEAALDSVTYYHSAMRFKKGTPKDNLEVRFIEPVPAELIEPEMVLSTSRNPNAALLFLEHQASPEGQKIIDDHEPLKASIYSPVSTAARLVAGKRVCFNGFKTFQNTGKWMQMAVEAFGFPRAEKR